MDESLANGAAHAASGAKRKATLTAVTVTWQGRTQWTVRVSVNGRDVGLPDADADSAVADTKTGGRMALEGTAGMDRRMEGLDTSLFGSTKRSADSLDHDHPGNKKHRTDPVEDSNNSTNGSDLDEDEENACNMPAGESGHSASAAGEGGGLSRENSSSSEAPAMATSADVAVAMGTGDGGSNFEASLLLGIAAECTVTSGAGLQQLEGGSSGKERREHADPATLPTSMTSFLDMLTEDQRRVRHRHIPGVDGFRKLYRSEVKADMSEARRIRRVKHLSKEGDDRDADCDDESRGETAVSKVEDNIRDAAAEEGEGEQGERRNPGRDAFVVPEGEALTCARGGQLPGLIESNDFENSICSGGVVAPNGSSSAAASFTCSPQIVDSMTSFDPPRPQESTAHKTRHRLKRWEAEPNEVEVDLANYRKTVTRTREELQNAKRERECIEGVASLMRDHFMNHLIGYRREMIGANEQLQRINASCLKLEEQYGGRSASTRGNARGIRDALGVLSSLGEEIQGLGGLDGVAWQDWRVAGVGGVRASKGGTYTELGQNAMIAGGWILVGDEVVVISSGEEGTVLRTPPPPRSDDALDFDTLNRGKSSIKSMKGGKSMPEGPITNARAKISVALAKSGQVKDFSTHELEFNPERPPSLASYSNNLLAARWQGMISTASENNSDHDTHAMDSYISASLGKEQAAAYKDRNEDRNIGNDDDEGRCSPKSVARHDGDDACVLLPFDSGLFAAPVGIKDYPCAIPIDNLEETVRKVVYEAGGPRVVPAVTPLSEVGQIQARREEMNALRGKAMQLRNRLGRQKRLRGLNECSLTTGKSRAQRVEGLLLEMQMDLKNLKERLQEELSELGVGNSPVGPLSAPKSEGDEDGMVVVEDGALGSLVGVIEGSTSSGDNIIRCEKQSRNPIEETNGGEGSGENIGP